MKPLQCRELWEAWREGSVGGADGEDGGVASRRAPSRLRWGLVVVVLIAGAWGLYINRSSPPEMEEPAGPQPTGPNVLLISIDMLRQDHLNCYGYDRQTSPRLDQLAAEGVLFENHISSTSWTLPAHAALFTSLVDSVHGCTAGGSKLSRNVVTLAEQFAEANYQTAGFFSGPYLHPAFGLGQGFQHYENCTSYAKSLDGNFAGSGDPDFDFERSSHRDVTNPIIYAAVKKWLEGNGGSKFFVFVHMWDAHFDFIPPQPYDTMFDPDYRGAITGEDFAFNPQINPNMPRRDLEHLLALYDGEIAWTDHYMDKIIDDLEQAGLLENTVVAITSDHGTEFFDHGKKGHRRTLFDEVIRIPLVIRYPAGLPQGVRVHCQTHITDVGPTLLELAGVASGVDTMGHSLVPVARDPGMAFDHTAVSELFSIGYRMRSIRTLEWKFTHVIASDRRYYVDLTKDPREQSPRPSLLTRGQGPELMERYRAIVKALGAWRAEISSGGDQATIPEEVLRQLESLGYVGDRQP